MKKNKKREIRRWMKELAVDVLTGALLGLILGIFFYFYLVRMAEIGG